MKRFRNQYLWTGLGCLCLVWSASAQSGNWRQATPVEPSRAQETRATTNGVRLGAPIPIAESGAIRQASYSVARGARPIDDGDPDGWLMPAHLATVPVAPRPQPAILEFAARQPAQAGGPKPLTPGSSVVLEERVIYLNEGAGFGYAWYPSFGSPSRFYASAEWLMWTTRGFHLPPLVTTASPFDPEATRAALGFGTTRTLFGDGNTLGGLRPGARFTAGWNLDPCGLCAIEGSFFFLSRKNDGAFFDNTVLGRPFFNINTGMQDRELTTSPGLLPGDIFNGVGNLQVQTSTTLLGAEVNHRRFLCGGECGQVTALVGFRYLNLSDRLSITEDITSRRDIPAISRAGDRVFVSDRFDTANRFYGGQVGASAAWFRGPWSLESQFKLGLGVTQQSIDIDGRQQITSVDGRVANFTGGLYALPSNIGHHAQSRFAIVPEIGLKVGFNVTENVRITAGYDFLYWNSVVRPGDQIDQALDANQVPNSGAPFPPATQRRPIVPFQTSSFWAHGFNAGLEWRY